MRVLALDISTRTGWSLSCRTVGQEGEPTIEKFGNVMAEQKVADYGSYPFNYWTLAHNMAEEIFRLVDSTSPDVIVVEETNKGKQRYSQKLLEFLHCSLLGRLRGSPWQDRIFYVNTSDWRAALDVYLNKDEKKNNAKVSKAKKKGISKKVAGVKGRVTRKHVAIRVVLDRFGLKFKQKENDIAEAILLGAAYHYGVPICDGKDNGKRKRNERLGRISTGSSVVGGEQSGDSSTSTGAKPHS